MVVKSGDGNWYGVGHIITDPNNDNDDGEHVVVEIYDSDDSFMIKIKNNHLQRYLISRNLKNAGKRASRPFLRAFFTLLFDASSPRKAQEQGSFPSSYPSSPALRPKF